VGLWQANFADLASVGIEVSAGQREVLRTGGEVLVIQGLVEPGSFYCGCGMGHPAYDTNGDRVMVAQTMTSYPADDIAPSVFLRPAGTNYLSELIDVEVDEHWKFWPSYTGRLEVGVDCMEYETMAYEDRPMIRRIWSGIPVEEIGAKVAFAIIQACNSRVEATPWWYIDRMIGYMESEELPDAEALADDQHGEYSDYLEAAKGLEQCGMFSIAERDFTTEFGTDLDYPPMDRYLDAQALSVWNNLLRTTRSNSYKASRTIKKGERNLYSSHESEFDPWF
jgi:hypothetical protein